MVESMLRAAGYRTGMFTSPHLVDVRERVRVNGAMVPRPVFEEHFWRCHDALAAAARPITLLIGPEAGFGADELADARTAGCPIVTLGDTVLRTETAAIVAAAVVRAQASA